MRHATLGQAAQSVSVSIYDTPEALGQALAQYLLPKITSARVAGRRFLLGCPGGRSLQTTYAALGEQTRQEEADLSNLVIVMMDDYVLPSPTSFMHCPAEAHYSCRRFARQEIWAILNRGLAPSRQLPEAQVWFPDPANPAAYDIRLQEAGGVDLFLIASGASDGHVAFNPPGSQVDELTRIISLAETTRRDNMKTFPDFKDIGEVPGHGVSVGLGTIAKLSRQVILVIHGAHKQEAVRRLAECEDFTPDWPASIIFRCREPHIFLDEAAAEDFPAQRFLRE
jgi:glucosamine-6-phosphate deaminase